MNTLLRVIVNGNEEHRVDVLDRGLHYGDGVFRTLLIKDGKPKDWERHLKHLLADAGSIGITSIDPVVLGHQASTISQEIGQATLKIILTRGSSGRGYRQDRTAPPSSILLVYSLPDMPVEHGKSGIRVRLCETRLARNPRLAGIKHLNRLEQVLARAEWDDSSITEGLMLDTEGFLIEGTSSNLFLVQDGTLKTPKLTQCGVEGVTRERILEEAPRYSKAVDICDLTLEDLYQSDECFICNSLFGIRPIVRLDNRQWEIGAVTRSFQQYFGEICPERE